MPPQGETEILLENRRDAGRRLGAALAGLAGPEAIVLGLARGGVVVGAEIAAALGAPLEAIITRKLGAPGNPEYAVGAIAEDGEPVVDAAEAELAGLAGPELARLVAEQRLEVARLRALYRAGRPLPSLRGRPVVLADDGIATGLTMRAAVQLARAGHAGGVVVAVPVGPAEPIAALRRLADDVVCLATPSVFYAVGASYLDFSQVTDDDVRACLARAARPGT